MLDLDGSSEQGSDPTAPRVHRQSICDHRQEEGAPGSQTVEGAVRITAAFEAAAADGRAALIPYAVAGYPDADTSFPDRSRAPSTAVPTCSKLGLPYSDPLADGATLQRASDGGPGQWRVTRRLHRPGRPHPRGPAPHFALAMGYVNQVLGGKERLRPCCGGWVRLACRVSSWPTSRPTRVPSWRPRQPGSVSASSTWWPRPPRSIGGSTWPSTAPASCTRSRWPA